MPKTAKRKRMSDSSDESKAVSKKTRGEGLFDDGLDKLRKVVDSEEVDDMRAAKTSLAKEAADDDEAKAGFMARGRGERSSDSSSDFDDESLRMLSASKGNAGRGRVPIFTSSDDDDTSLAEIKARKKSLGQEFAKEIVASDISVDDPMACQAKRVATKELLASDSSDAEPWAGKTKKGAVKDKATSLGIGELLNSKAKERTMKDEAASDSTDETVMQENAASGRSDDEPLASKTNGGTNRDEPFSSSEEEPLASKIKRGGSTEKSSSDGRGDELLVSKTERGARKDESTSDGDDDASLTGDTMKGVVKKKAARVCGNKESSVVKKMKANLKKEVKSKRSDDDESIKTNKRKKPAARKTSAVKNEKENSNQPKEEEFDADCSDDEPLAKKVVKIKGTSKLVKVADDPLTKKTDRSDDQPLPKKTSRDSNSDDAIDNEESADENPPSKRMAKTDEKNKDLRQFERQPKPASVRDRSASSSGVSDISLIDDVSEKAAKSSEKKVVRKGAKKKKDGREDKENRGAAAPKSTAKNVRKVKGVDGSGGLARLKKCARAAGLYLNYVSLFENVPKMMDQQQTIRDLLEAEGLEGNPTLEKCKKLRIQRESDAEVAALDLNNIIHEKVKRGSTPATRSSVETGPMKRTQDSEDEEVKGRRILKRNSTLFDYDDSDP